MRISCSLPCAGTGTLRADTVASTVATPVSMASSVPISGRSARLLGSFSCVASSSTMAFAPVTEAMRPMERGVTW